MQFKIFRSLTKWISFSTVLFLKAKKENKNHREEIKLKWEKSISRGFQTTALSHVK